jgi:hypothetical protein
MSTIRKPLSEFPLSDALHKTLTSKENTKVYFSNFTIYKILSLIVLSASLSQTKPKPQQQKHEGGEKPVRLSSRSHS